MPKKDQKNGNLEAMRHSCEHVLTMAMLRLYPKLKPAMGPATNEGFYFDFEFDRPILAKEFKKIEAEMHKIVKENLPIIKDEMTVAKARKFFSSGTYQGNKYKHEWIDEIEERKEKVTVYWMGKKGQDMPTTFVDICSGPHLKSTKEIGPFKLLSLAGAYWRGDEKNKMLQRIYGTCFSDQKSLEKYLHNIEEAKKRDHRELNKQLDFFLVDPIVGMGLPMFQPKGAMLWRIMEDFWYKEHLKNGYELVRSPHIGNRKLWETSGHWGFYNDSMYPSMEVGQSLSDAQKGLKAKIKEEYLIKPMNCPFHIILYKSKPKSYRDLPIRWAECGTVYRYEKSGEVSGLVRVRGFTQDDAHIICTKEQAEKELKRVLDFIIFIFRSFGFSDYKIYLSVRDPKEKKYAGSDEGWKFTEEVLEKVAKEKKLDYEKDVGGAVFYGPKLDFKVRDSLGREWQCSTLQYDFNLPEKFAMTYIDKNGEEKQPYVLHRALFGSFERFIGCLIEHYAGAFPVWLAPVQVKVLTISPKHLKYSQKVLKKLKEQGIRSELDDDEETVGKKIRNAELEKVPYILIIGDKEIKSNKVAVRVRGKGDQGAVNLAKFIKEINEQIANKK